MTDLEMAKQQLKLAVEFVENSRQQLIRAEQHKAKMQAKVTHLQFLEADSSKWTDYLANPS